MSEDEQSVTGPPPAPAAGTCVEVRRHCACTPEGGKQKLSKGYSLASSGCWHLCNKTAADTAPTQPPKIFVFKYFQVCLLTWALLEHSCLDQGFAGLHLPPSLLPGQ